MYEFLKYKVGDVMTRRPVIVTPDSTLDSLKNVLDEHGFNAVPVSDDGQRLVGLVSKYDLLSAFVFTADRIIPSYEQIMKQPVQSVMTTDPATVTTDLPLTRVLELLVQSRHKSFPVLQSAKIVGMVAREDVIGALVRARQAR